MSTRPKTAMVLAAGLGMRMRPITLTTPKPLVPVAGRTMLDRALDHLADIGFGPQGGTRCVVNTHWLSKRIQDHLSNRPDITLIHETELLETGGGVVNALPLLGPDPFYVINSDIIWTDGPTPALRLLADAWDDERMDALLLLQPTTTATGYDGAGDFFFDPPGPPRRRGESKDAPLLFSGVQILHPRLFTAAPSGKFSLNTLYDRALAKNRLHAIIHDGQWFHVGTPDALPKVEALLHGTSA